jgi:hypothetical protein
MLTDASASADVMLLSRLANPLNPHLLGSAPPEDLSTRDATAHTLWLLVRENKKLLAPSKDALGLPGTQLVEPLLALVEAREDQETAEDQEVRGLRAGGVVGQPGCSGWGILSWQLSRAWLGYVCTSSRVVCGGMCRASLLGSPTVCLFRLSACH